MWLGKKRMCTTWRISGSRLTQQSQSASVLIYRRRVSICLYVLSSLRPLTVMSSEGPRKVIRKVHLSAVLPCPHPGCTAGPFRNKTGLGSHITARHRAAVLPPDEQRLRLGKSTPSPERPQSSSSPPPPSSPSPPPPDLEENASTGPSGASRGPGDNTGNNDGWRPVR